MRVALDTSPLSQTRAGTARYIEQLAGLADVELVRLAFRGRGRAATVARDAVWYPAVLPALAARARVDLLHCPSFRGPPVCPVPLVVTVHDLAVLRRPDWFNTWTQRYSAVLVPRVVRAARLVIAVSEFTRRELAELLDTPDEKVRVVPNGVAPVFAPDGPAAEGDYVLAVGTLEPRKNLPRLVAAARRAGVELRIAGSRGWGRVEVGGPGVRWLGEPSDEALAALYRGARCVAYPSLYEGFGIPVLEAMACGAAVVTSAGGALEELAAGAAVLVDPLDPAAIAAGLEEAASRRGELGRLGLERARRYSWAAVGEATRRVYEEALA